MNKETGKISPHSPWVRGLRGAAEYLGLGLSTVKQCWPSWEKSGVTAYRYGRVLRFKKSELDRLFKPVNA